MSRIAKLTIVFLVIITIAVSFGAGYSIGGRFALGAPEGIAIVERAWNILFADYVDRSKLDSERLSQAAIEGMIKYLDDPYTTYLAPKDFQQFLTGLHGAFEGIGATVGLRDNQVTVIAPIAGSPAARAGIKPGDVILAVDGKSTANLTVNDVVIQIRGPKGTPVRITVLHIGEANPVEIEIIRDTIKLTSVSSEMRGDIAVINISQFAEKTDEELTAILKTLPELQAKGIIIDMRSNPGGLLDSVVKIASHFLKEGVVVSVKSNQEQIRQYPVDRTQFYTELPVLVLVDNFSASGSEVLAGALQDYERATIAGAKTFGKGSVNILRQLNGAGMYVTTARWLTPNGRLIEGKGIFPDVQLDPNLDAIQWGIDYLHRK